MYSKRDTLYLKMLLFFDNLKDQVKQNINNNYYYYWGIKDSNTVNKLNSFYSYEGRKKECFIIQYKQRPDK